MGKLTLDKAWELCLELWAWIVEQIEAGSEDSVETLKIKWFEEHEGVVAYLDCFFCHYSRYNGGKINCYAACPGRLIDGTFKCDHDDYAYDDEPLKFYAKLLELNEKRKAQ